MSKSVSEQIKEIVNQHDVVLFMKGTAVFPQCGFSAAVVQILNSLNVRFHDVNVLDDEDIRQGIKDYSNWPTIPQLYLKGEFIGGCDIVREMAANSELQEMLTQKQITFESKAA